MPADVTAPAWCRRNSGVTWKCARKLTAYMPRTAKPRNWSRETRRAGDVDGGTSTNEAPSAAGGPRSASVIGRVPFRLSRHGDVDGRHPRCDLLPQRRFCQVPVRLGKPRPLGHLADGPVLVLVAV